MSIGPVVWQVGKWLLVAVAIATIGLIVFVAFARRDHKVELIVTYPKSPPSEVWRLLTDHASEPKWLPAFGTVVRQPDIAGREVWTHTSPDGSFSATATTLSAIPEQRYERLLLRDGQPRNQSWDGRWIYELQPSGTGTRLTITEFGWSDGFLFFLQQRVLANPDAFLKHYAMMLGRELKDEPHIQVVRSHRLTRQSKRLERLQEGEPTNQCEQVQPECKRELTARKTPPLRLVYSIGRR